MTVTPSRAGQRERRRIVREERRANDADGALTADQLGEKLAREIELTNTRAIESYRPRPYADSIVLFRATQRTSESMFYKIDRTSTGWGALTDGRVRIIDLAGNHFSILSMENAQVAAEKLRPFLCEERCVLAR